MVLNFIQEKQLNLNPYKNIINFQLSTLQIVSNSNENDVLMHSYEYLIINDIQFNKQITKSRYTFENIPTIIIENLDLQNVDVQSNYDEFLLFKNITEILIRHINVLDCNLNSTLMVFESVEKIEIKNFTSSKNTVHKGIISVSNSGTFQLNNITITNNQLKKEQNETDKSFIFSLSNVQNTFITENYIEKMQDLGFINLIGNIANSYQTSVLEIKNSNFTNSKIKQPIIKVKYVKEFTLNRFNATQVDYDDSISFMSIEQTKNIDIEEFSINNTSRNDTQDKRLLQIKNKNENKNSFLLSFKGIDNTKIKNINFTECNNAGILNLTNFELSKQNLLISANLTIEDINFKNSTNTNKEPLFNIQSQQINLTNMIVENITTRHHIIQANQFQEFNISKSKFKSINLNDISTVLNTKNLQQQSKQGILIIKNTTFNETLSQNSSSLISYDLNSVILNNSTFFKLKNYNQNSKKNIENYEGIINVQQCNTFEVIDSTFENNISYLNGGSLFIIGTNVTINSSTFKNNSAQEQSGGAIYLSDSNMTVISSTFNSNIAVKGRGGAICSIESNMNIKNVTIENNNATIGGGVYYNYNKTFLEVDCKYSSNIGYFYGNNKGSKPWYIRRIDPESKKQSEYININYFQSGNYTKETIYVQFIDEEFNILNFTRMEQKNSYSDIIDKEIQEIKIELNFYEGQNQKVNILDGKQLELDLQNEKFKNYYKLYFAAQQKYGTQEFKGSVYSTYSKNQALDLYLQFRDCIIGEIKFQKNGYIQCSECQNRSYSLEDPNENENIVCKRCPAEASDCMGSNIILFDNYWRPNNLSDSIFQCPSNGCSESNYQSKQGCTEGYIGPVCASCDYNGQIWGRIYGVEGQDCHLCSELKYVYLYLAATIIFYVFYINHSISSQILQKSLIIKLNYLRIMDMLFLSKTKQNGADSTILTKIFLHYFQIFTVSLDFLSNLPTGFQNTFQAVGDPSRVTYKSYDCMFSSSIIPQLWLNRLIVLICQIAFTSFIILLIIRYQSRKNQKKLRISIYAIFLFFFYYPSITKLLISLSLCKQFGQKSYLQGDYLQECWTSNHIILSIFLIYPLTIIWAILIPLLLLYKIKSAIKQRESQSIAYILSYYFIQQGYKSKYYYWEIVKMFYKFLIMLFLNTTYSVEVQRVIICFIYFTYLQAIQRLKPYSSKLLMNLELLLSQIIVCSLILQLFINTNDQKDVLYFCAVILITSFNMIGILEFVKVYLIFTKAKLLKLKESKFKQMLLKIKYFRAFIEKQHVPLLRTSYLWKRLRLGINEYKQRSVLISNDFIVKKNVQRKFESPGKNDDNLVSSYQDLIMQSQPINTPVLSKINSARQDKLFVLDSQNALKQKQND